jgi:hypothetical protein
MEFWRRVKERGPRRRTQRERDLEREIQSHLDLEAEDSGDAGARRAFGNVLRMKEDVRAAWGWARVEQAWRDVCYGLGQIRRNPGFSCIAIATLALGIGVNTAMFSAVDAVLIRPLPYADADRLVMVWDDTSPPSVRDCVKADSSTRRTLGRNRPRRWSMSPSPIAISRAGRRSARDSSSDALASRATGTRSSAS